MDVHRTATVVAALLVATGVIAFLVSDSRSATALIPALLGVVVGVLVVAARRVPTGPGVVVGYAVVGALGALGSLGRVVPALTGGVEVPVALAAQVVTVVLGGWLTLAAVQHLRGRSSARS